MGSQDEGESQIVIAYHSGFTGRPRDSRVVFKPPHVIKQGSIAGTTWVGGGSLSPMVTVKQAERGYPRHWAFSLRVGDSDERSLGIHSPFCGGTDF